MSPTTVNPSPRPRRAHPARRARRITGAVSLATFVGLTGAIAAHTANGGGTSSSAASSTKVTTSEHSGELDDERSSTAVSASAANSSSTATSHTVTRGS